MDWKIGNRQFHWGRQTYVMGILNVTPDSFSDGGRYQGLDAALAHAEDLIAAGADILDIGGESTRPGAPLVSAEDEIDRVIPVIKRLVNSGAVLSIDTYKPEVARAALEAGVHIINDISGMRDSRMLEVLAEYRAPVVAMHMQGTPDTMQQNPQYRDVVQEVRDYLWDCYQRAQAVGVPLIADPGIGFGKTFEHNLALLRRLPELKLPGVPLLVGTSRKGFLGKILDVPPDQRDEGTSATVALSIQAGVDIVRVHNVAMVAQVAKVSDVLVRAHG